MATPSARILRLLSLLQTHRFWPGPEFADRLEVSIRTLRRDVDRLRELGYPVDAQRGLDGGYQLGAGATLPPLVLDDDEAVALAIGLRAAAQGAVVGIEEASLRALAKIAQIMPPRLRSRVDALRAVTVPAAWGQAGPTVDAGLLTTLAQASRDTERVRFAYAAPSGETSQRHVEPHWLVALGRRWYLVAFDLHRDAWRTFRVDRLSNPRSTLVRFEPQALPGADPAAYVRAQFGALSPGYTIEALVFAPAADVQARIGQWATIEPRGASQCRVTMRADSLDWPTFALGTVGAEFELGGPPELVAQLDDWSRRFARATTRRGQRIDSSAVTDGMTNDGAHG